MGERRYLFSGSMLPLVAKCRPAGVLPRVGRIGDRDRMGNALHEHARDRLLYGIDGAVERLGAVAQAWHLDEREESIMRARAMGFEFTPPRGAMPEIALCLCDDGRVEVVEGGRGVYERLPEGGTLPTQIDIFWAEPLPLYLDAAGRVRCPPDSVLYVGDYKTGQETFVDDVERNLQTMLGCVLAAKWTGARFAIPAIIYWRKGKGIWDVPPAPYDAAALAQAEQGILQLHAEAAETKRRIAAGDPVTYTTGRHCTFCDAETYCTAKVASMKRYLDDPRPLDATQLTADQALHLARVEAQIARFSENLRGVLVAYTKARGPIPEVAPGKSWGAYTKPTSSIDGAVALEALAQEIGSDDANKALKVEVSKSAMEEAIKASHKRSGIARQVSAAMRRVLGRVRAGGGFVDGLQIRFGLHATVPGKPADPYAITMPGDEDLQIDGDDL